MLDMEAIKNFSIDKSNWQKVKFGDVVFEPKESVKNPIAEGIEHVVGLEHIDREDIHLRRSASIEESTTFTKKFRVGDVLFGRRRAYLKKAAKAEFEGICSGDITVMRVKEELLLPELLPFIVNNDSFFDYAITHSAGGLSPRVKFKDLEKYEFLLPTFSEQKRLLELFFSVDQLHINSAKTDSKMNTMFVSEREKLNFYPDEGKKLIYHSKLKLDVDSSFEFRTLGSVLKDIKYGTSKKANMNGQGYGVLGIPHVVNEKLTVDNIACVDLTESEYKSARLTSGDILIVRTNGNPSYTGRSALYDLNEGHAFASYLIKISVDTSEYDQEFLIRYLQTNTIRRYFKRHATTSAGNYNINTDTIKNVPVPKISLQNQQEIVTRLKLLEGSMLDSRTYKHESNEILKGLTGMVF